MTTHVPKFKNHIERLKFNISEMEVATRAVEERLIASEAQVADQERIIHSNALLLQALQTQQLARLGEVQGQHICLQAEHFRVQRSLVESERVRNERVKACNAYEEEVTGLRLESETL